MLRVSPENCRRRERFSAGIHLDVEIVREAEVLQVEQLKGNRWLLFVGEPRVESLAASKALVHSLEHVESRDDSRIETPVTGKPVLVDNPVAQATEFPRAQVRRMRD